MNKEDLEMYAKKLANELVQKWEKIELLKNSDYQTYKEKVRLEWDLKIEMTKEKAIHEMYKKVEEELIIRMLLP